VALTQEGAYLQRSDNGDCLFRRDSEFGQILSRLYLRKNNGGNLNSFQPADAYGQESSGPNPNKVSKRMVAGEKSLDFSP